MIYFCVIMALFIGFRVCYNKIKSLTLFFWNFITYTRHDHNIKLTAHRGTTKFAVIKILLMMSFSHFISFLKSYIYGCKKKNFLTFACAVRLIVVRSREDNDLVAVIFLLLFYKWMRRVASSRFFFYWFRIKIKGF